MTIIKCGIILEQNNKILLVYGYKSKKWGFPKGHMEYGETEEETAQRELYEETGIYLDNSHLTKKIRFKNNIYFMVKLDESKKVQINIKDSIEIQLCRWFTIEEILSLKIEECNFGLKVWLNKRNYCP
jgi:tRNA nucleotidyltransferase (CCA-adding enzyme)